MPGARPWSGSERRAILLGAGAYGTAWLQSKTRAPHCHPNAAKTRSVDAVKSQARRMGLGGLTRGTRSLESVIQGTGYSRTHLFRAQRALRQKWKRTGARGQYLLTDDQVDDLCGWLLHDYWCKRKALYRCLWCTSDSRPHRAIGLCDRCYFGHLSECERLGLPANVKAQARLVTRIRDRADREEERAFLKGAAWRLARGLALEKSQLDWLAVLHPGGVR